MCRITKDGSIVCDFHVNISQEQLAKLFGSDKATKRNAADSIETVRKVFRRMNEPKGERVFHNLREFQEWASEQRKD